MLTRIWNYAVIYLSHNYLLTVGEIDVVMFDWLLLGLDLSRTNYRSISPDLSFHIIGLISASSALSRVWSRNLQLEGSYVTVVPSPSTRGVKSMTSARFSSSPIANNAQRHRRDAKNARITPTQSNVFKLFFDESVRTDWRTQTEASVMVIIDISASWKAEDQSWVWW